jgi:hypothetical protein
MEKYYILLGNEIKLILKVLTKKYTNVLSILFVNIYMVGCGFRVSPTKSVFEWGFQFKSTP